MLNTQNWLSLIEYSATYRVSLSTLRRRIKAGEVEFKLIEGKYLIKNDRLQVQVSQSGSETIAPPPQVSSQNQIVTSPRSAPAETAQVPSAAPAPIEPEQYWKATQALLAELKKAFAHTLASKDEQIRHLKDEVSNLKMLVEVLEDETRRLKASPALNFDLGLEA